MRLVSHVAVCEPHQACWPLLLQESAVLLEASLLTLCVANFKAANINQQAQLSWTELYLLIDVSCLEGLKDVTEPLLQTFPGRLLVVMLRTG